jgi:enoyl-CoA hydratase/carnithine racemase
VIRVAIADAIATVTLCHPPVNAVSNDWLARFNGELDALALRSDWHVLHIRSEQKVFCAGADLREMQDRFRAADGPDATLAYVAAIQRLYARIEALPQVTVAEIGGAAMGGGLELALACDLRIAAAEAKLGLPEARLGLLPGAGGTQRLTRLCGRAVSSRLILGAEVVDGTTAAALGLVQWAAPRAELASRAYELVQRVAALPSAALAACKECITAAGEPGRSGYTLELEHTRRRFMAADTQQRVAAFLDGRLR